MVNLYETFNTSPGEWGSSGVNIFWNLFFNAIDLAYEYLFLVKGLEERQWQTIGENIGKMISDVFIKSPISESWDYKNSDEFSQDWDEPYELLEEIK